VVPANAPIVPSVSRRSRASIFLPVIRYQSREIIPEIFYS
jgi:hypothetical protein